MATRYIIWIRAMSDLPWVRMATYVGDWNWIVSESRRGWNAMIASGHISAVHSSMVILPDDGLPPIETRCKKRHSK